MCGALRHAVYASSGSQIEPTLFADHRTGGLNLVKMDGANVGSLAKRVAFQICRDHVNLL
jgi:hypothetical protein